MQCGQPLSARWRLLVLVAKLAEKTMSALCEGRFRRAPASCQQLRACTGFSSQALLTCSGRHSNSFPTTLPGFGKETGVLRFLPAHKDKELFISPLLLHVPSLLSESICSSALLVSGAVHTAQHHGYQKAHAALSPPRPCELLLLCISQGNL